MGTTVAPVVNCRADATRKNQKSISKASVVKTIEAKRMVYLCDLDGFRSYPEINQPMFTNFGDS